jgi:3-oxoadipate enol-lactonase
MKKTILHPVLLFAAALVMAACSTVTRSRIIERSYGYSNPGLTAKRISLDKSSTVISYYDIGEGLPIIFLHGAVVDKDSWQFQVIEFSGDYRVIVPDLPLHGYSITGSDIIDIDFYVSAVADFMESAGIKSAIICSHSMGGMIAQKFAVEYPEKVTALILADTSYGIRTSFRDRMLADYALKYFENNEMPELIEDIAEDWGKISIHTKKYLYFTMFRYLDHKDEFLNIWSAVDSFSYDYAKVLPKLNIPVLILTPEKNSQAAGQAKKMLKLIPDSQMIIIPDAGHFAMLDNPEDFNDIVRNFLEDNNLK